MTAEQLQNGIFLMAAAWDALEHAAEEDDPAIAISIAGVSLRMAIVEMAADYKPRPDVPADASLVELIEELREWYAVLIAQMN